MSSLQSEVLHCRTNYGHCRGLVLKHEPDELDVDVVDALLEQGNHRQGLERCVRLSLFSCLPASAFASFVLSCRNDPRFASLFHSSSVLMNEFVGQSAQFLVPRPSSAAFGQSRFSTIPRGSI